MLKKFLKEVISIVVGKQAEEIIEILSPNKYVNEFLIAKKLDITINQARNILYRLSNYGLVSSIRKKNKKKGWYTYFWKIENLKTLEFLRGTLLKRIEQTNNQIKNRESKDFYVCERCDIELNEETALLNDFTCRECGGVFSSKDKTKILKDLKKEVEKLKRDLGFIDTEIQLETAKIEKKLAKELKKTESKEKTKKSTKKTKSKKKKITKKK